MYVFGGKESNGTNFNLILSITVCYIILFGNFSTKLESVLDAGKTRFIPVVLTTITTSAGIFPLIFIDSFWAGLAYTIIFGLSISSFLTLFLIPIGYLLFEKTPEISH